MTDQQDTTTTTTAMEVELNPQQQYEIDVAKAKLNVEALKNRAKKAQRLADDAVEDDTKEEEHEALINIANKKWTSHNEFRANMAVRFPLEPYFSNGTTSTQQPAAAPMPINNDRITIRLDDMPFLVAAREKSDRPRSLVLKSAKEFITRLEELMNLHQVDITSNYQRYLPLLISKSYKLFIDTQRSSLKQGQIETWTMMKGWLMEFSNTPEQRVKNTIAWTELTPKRDETGEDFFLRLRDAADEYELEKISIDAMAFFAIYNNLSNTWRRKVYDAITVREGSTPFLKKTFKEMCAFVAELELHPRERNASPPPSPVKRQRVDNHREPRQSRSERGSWNDFAVGPGPQGPYPGGGHQCSKVDVEDKPPSHHQRQHQDRHQQQGSSSSSSSRTTYRDHERPVSRAASRYIDGVKAADAKAKDDSLVNNFQRFNEQ
ncbi:unnamed protein product [Absidia cylindrospora]